MYEENPGGEFLIVNPRRRRRHHRRRSASGQFLAGNPRRRHHRLRVHRTFLANPRRHRRALRVRHYVTNPSVLGLDLGAVATVAGGAFGSNLAMSGLGSIFPAVSTGLPRAAGKAALAVVVSMLGKRLIGPRLANGLAIGVGASAVLDVLHAVMPSTTSLGAVSFPIASGASAPIHMNNYLNPASLSAAPVYSRTVPARMPYWATN